jgi:hypothetical protein
MWDAVLIALVLLLGSAVATPAAAERLYSPEETHALLECLEILDAMPRIDRPSARRDRAP